MKNRMLYVASAALSIFLAACSSQPKSTSGGATTVGTSPVPGASSVASPTPTFDFAKYKSPYDADFALFRRAKIEALKRRYAEWNAGALLPGMYVGCDDPKNYQVGRDVYLWLYPPDTPEGSDGYAWAAAADITGEQAFLFVHHKQVRAYAQKLVDQLKKTDVAVVCAAESGVNLGTREAIQAELLNAIRLRKISPAEAGVQKTDFTVLGITPEQWRKAQAGEQ